jgi:superoxide dismutase, Fe-Mn family
MTMTRREAVTSGVLVAGAASVLTSGGVAMADQEPKTNGAGGPRVPRGKHAITPLPFDPKKLKGLSERLLVSHHENNYGGAIKNLNKVEEELGRVSKDTPGFIVAGLKERELTFTNSVILHELYFGNLGGDGKSAAGIQRAIGDACGGFAQWEDHFRATGMSLSGGSGWVVLDFNFHTGDLRTYWSGNHTQAVAFGQPLLVMDMYEHAYQMDFGAAAAKYIDAFFASVRWEEVNRRLERAQKAAAALRA